MEKPKTAPVWHHLSYQEVLQKLETDQDGLSLAVVQKRQVVEGKNEILTKSGNSPLRVLIKQFYDPLILLLIAAGAVSALVNTEKPAESIAIFAIVGINALLGFVQEYRAEQALKALSKMAPKQTVVKRDGQEQKIDAKELVPGDIIRLETGDAIPADARIINAFNLKINESALTGESTTVAKHAEALSAKMDLADRTNCLYMGTLVSEGRCLAVVIATGNETEFGKIATSLGSVKNETTPLQKKFGKLAQQITYLAAFLILIVFAIGYFQWHDGVGKLLLFALVLAVGTVPSALPLIVTFSLSLGARHLAGVNLLLRNLPAAESMGSVDFICTDKTGTLTRNEMTVTQLYVGGQDWPVAGDGYHEDQHFHLTDPEAQTDVERLCQIALHCNDAHVVHDQERLEIIGDPMEGALVVLSHKAGWEKTLQRVEEFPFDSERKRMSVVMKDDLVLVKGAAEGLLEKCTHWQVNGQRQKLTSADKESILTQQDQYAQKALRVLGFAYKEGAAKTLEEAESGLTFVGLVGIQDPPRAGVKESIAECQTAGIRVMMITGDHLTTAKAIAQQIGLIQPKGLCLEGHIIEGWDDQKLRSEVRKINVIARATPALKLRVVTALQAQNHVVAMTGDGVNDAPALKKADVGLAMGITGTDVAKESAKGVLLDDNFSTIVNAVREGRNIYEKIIKSTKYLLSCNFSEIFAVLGSLVFFNQVPLQPLQILMINILTDSAPAAGLSMEKSEAGIMKRRPRRLDEKPITREKLIMITLFGTIMGSITVAMFGFHLHLGLDHAQTIAFTTLVMMQLFAVTSMRSFTFDFKNLNLLTNPSLLAGIVFSVVLQILAIYTPWAQNLLGTVPLSLNQWGLILMVAVGSYALFEVGKIVFPEIKTTAKQNT